MDVSCESGTRATVIAAPQFPRRRSHQPASSNSPRNASTPRRQHGARGQRGGYSHVAQVRVLGEGSGLDHLQVAVHDGSGRKNRMNGAGKQKGGGGVITSQHQRHVILCSSRCTPGLIKLTSARLRLGELGLSFCAEQERSQAQNGAPVRRSGNGELAKTRSVCDLLQSTVTNQSASLSLPITLTPPCLCTASGNGNSL